MTLGELIGKVTLLRPSEYDKDELTQWVNEVEFMAYDQVIGMAEPARKTAQQEAVTVTRVETGDNSATAIPDVKPPTLAEYQPYDYETDMGKVLLIPDQFNGCYTSYLFSKIDFHNAEIDRYNLDAAMFSSEWAAYAGWYRRTHKPRRITHETPNSFYSPI